MKMISHRNKSQKKGKIFLILLLFVIVFLFLFNNKNELPNFISNPVVAISKPFLILSNSADDWINGISFIFKEKRELSENNIFLREKINFLEARLMSYETFKNENNELKNLLSRTNDREYIAASVILRPPKSPYDMLIIDAGKNHGIEKGMPVTAYADILIGYIIDVFSNTSKVKLISFSNEETNVILQSSGIPVIAVGIGSENLEITLPRSIEIKNGEKIITTGMNPFIVGIVDNIEIDATDAFQKIFLRIPLNIQELKYVMIPL